MSFFDDVIPGEDEPPEAETGEMSLTATPPWFSPPEQWVLPAVLPGPGKIAEGGQACVAISSVLCWPESVSVKLEIFTRQAARQPGDRPPFFFGRGPYGRPAPDGLRFGVVFADGHRLTNFDRQTPYSYPIPSTPPDTPVMRPTSGGGGEFHYQQSLYIWPLPPDGPLTVVVEWPDQAIAETRTELDATAIRAAAAQAVLIWSDLPPLPASDATTSSGHTVTTLQAGGSGTVAGGASFARRPEPDH
jgi:hypothetical protein